MDGPKVPFVQRCNWDCRPYVIMTLIASYQGSQGVIPDVSFLCSPNESPLYLESLGARLDWDLNMQEGRRHNITSMGCGWTTPTKEG